MVVRPGQFDGTGQGLLQVVHDAGARRKVRRALAFLLLDDDEIDALRKITCISRECTLTREAPDEKEHHWPPPKRDPRDGGWKGRSTPQESVSLIGKRRFVEWPGSVHHRQHCDHEQRYRDCGS